MRKTASQIADEVVATPTQEMVDHFNNRTNRHIELVRKYCTRLEDRIPGLDGLHQRGIDHDKSKYEAKEKIPYIWLTWRYKCEDDKKPCVLPTSMKRMIDEATEHHIVTNAHHPEFHQDKTTGLINKDDRDKPPKEMVDATKMSKLDLAEMVADWCAMSEERGNTPHEWAKKNVNVRWKYTPEQTKHINQFLDAGWTMKKTASQIADEVKLAIDVATLRRVSSGLMERHGVRGGIGINLAKNTGGFYRNPGKGKSIAFGPTMEPLATVKGKQVPFGPELANAAPSELHLGRGRILSGGRGGSLTSVFSAPHTKALGVSAPEEPMMKEIGNRVGLLHEGLERRAIKPGMTAATRARAWGVNPEVPSVAHLGLVGGGHTNPGVVLRESNILGTLQVPEAWRQSLRQPFNRLRQVEGSWPTIEKAVGRSLPYGEGRMSRHAIRRIEGLIAQGAR